MSKKKQSPFGRLLLLSGLGLTVIFSIIFIAAIFYFFLSFMDESNSISKAQKVADDLAKAADYIYSQSPCSKHTIDIDMPTGVNFVNVSENVIHIQISTSNGNSDVFASTEAELVGEIKTDAGSQKITVTHTADGKVMFGIDRSCSLFLFLLERESLLGDLEDEEEAGLSCSPSSLTENFVQGESGEDSFTITNIGEIQLTNISVEISGDIEDMTAVTQPGDSLEPGASDTIELDFFVPVDKPVDSYSGTIFITTNNGEYNATITIFVTAIGAMD